MALDRPSTGARQITDVPAHVLRPSRLGTACRVPNGASVDQRTLFVNLAGWTLRLLLVVPLLLLGALCLISGFAGVHGLIMIGVAVLLDWVIWRVCRGRPRHQRLKGETSPLRATTDA